MTQENSPARDQLKMNSNIQPYSKPQRPQMPLNVRNAFGDVKNVVTKFAFATRVGYIPNNPYKTNQDSFIL